MGRLEKTASIKNEVEALCLREELEARGIPHVIRSYYDSAYDGLFQFSAGWGHVEAPTEHGGEILEILEAMRRRAAGRTEQTGEEGNPKAG